MRRQSLSPCRKLPPSLGAGLAEVGSLQFSAGSGWLISLALPFFFFSSEISLLFFWTTRSIMKLCLNIFYFAFLWHRERHLYFSTYLLIFLIKNIFYSCPIVLWYEKHGFCCCCPSVHIVDVQWYIICQLYLWLFQPLKKKKKSALAAIFILVSIKRWYHRQKPFFVWAVLSGYPITLARASGAIVGAGSGFQPNEVDNAILCLGAGCIL